VFDGRGQPRAMWAAAVAAALCGLMLILSWFAGHPRRHPRRR
jgi:hypothetical protein